MSLLFPFTTLNNGHLSLVMILMLYINFFGYEFSEQYSPVGHYFASASHDRTARIWSMERIQPLRIMAGHLSDVDVSFSLTLLRVIKGN